MRNASPILLAAVILLGGCDISVRRLHGANPETMDRAVPRIEDVSFKGSAFSCILTSQGNIVLTTDRGKTWERIIEPVRDLLGRETEFDKLAFYDEYHGYAVTADGAVCQTTDSGRHWQKIWEIEIDPDDFGPVLQMTFIDEKHGWMIDPSNVWTTSDGGRGWTKCSIDREQDFDEVFAGGYFKNALAGWIYGTGGKVWRTVDGGKTWHSQVIAPDDQEILSLFFASERVAWIATQGETNVSGIYEAVSGIYKTKDGGTTWVLQELPERDAHVRSFQFVSEKEGWAAGGIGTATPAGDDGVEGLLLHTTDGGTSWARVQVDGEGHWFAHVFFADPAHGWVVSLNDVYITDDGGKTWYRALSKSGEQAN